MLTFYFVKDCVMMIVNSFVEDLKLSPLHVAYWKGWKSQPLKVGHHILVSLFLCFFVCFLSKIVIQCNILNILRIRINI